MTVYASIGMLLQDLPALAAPVQAQLMGRDNLFLLELKEGGRAYIRLKDGLVSVEEHAAHTPVCTVRAEEKALLDMMSGRLSPARALLTRKVVIHGNPGPLMDLIGLL